MFFFVVILYVNIHTSASPQFIIRKENCNRINLEDLYASNYEIDNLETFNKNVSTIIPV
jgi:hypothetical protein